MGRILNALNRGCTGWLISIGAVLTAGHCNSNGPFTIQFNVPMSNPNGAINNPGPKDIYSLTYVDSRDNGAGQDWAVARPGTTSDLTPALRQQAFVRLTALTLPVNNVTLRVTGYGLDGPPPNYGNNDTKNKYNRTEQTAVGMYIGAGKAANSICYTIDTQPGNSGSPVYLNGWHIAVAIHTQGDGKAEFCSQAANAGTVITQPDLVAAMAAFPGAPYGIRASQTFFVDEGSTATAADGKVLSPFLSLAPAFSAAKNSGADSLITLAPSGYAETSFTVTPAHNITLTLPVGDATLYLNMNN